MRTVFLDGSNLMHRARYGFGEGENNITYNFFRCLRPVIEKLSPDKVFFVLEGHPRDNVNLLPEYKANRKSSPDDFRRQRVDIETMVKELLPFVTLRHPHYECDDVLYTAVKRSPSADDCTIVSTDSDFMQLYDEFDNATIWDPIRKRVTPGVSYDYVTWKALRGDKSDNVPGVPRIGDKTAANLATNPSQLAERLQDPKTREIYERNVRLIKLTDMTSELSEIEVWDPKPDWKILREKFDSMGFKSITSEPTWSRFVATFDSVQPGRPSWLK